MPGSHVVLDGVTVFNSGSTGIIVDGDTCIVKNCTVYDVALNGFKINGNYTLLYRNIVYSATESGIRDWEFSSYNRYYNNTLYGNSIEGMYIEPGNQTSRAFNNIIINNNIGIRGDAGNICAFNNVIGNSGGNYDNGVVDSAGGLTVDPLFTDTASCDFSLQISSPCINTGLDLGYPFFGSAPDMGAIEMPELASLTITPTLDSMYADSTYQFDVIALDSLGQPVDPGTLTWSHSFATGDINFSGLFAPQLIGSGRLMVSSNINGVSDTTEIMNVVPGALDSIYITPNRDTISADSTQQFTAYGYDCNTNTIGQLEEIDWEILGTIGTIDSTGLFDATEAGFGFIKTESKLSPSINAITDTIIVLPGLTITLDVVPESNTLEESESCHYAAYGYDSENNLVADLTDSVTWSTTDTAGSITVGGLYTAGNIPADYYVKAVYGIYNDSGEVTVLSNGTLSYIRIEQSDGTPFGDTSLTTDNDTTELFCRGYDSGDSLLGDVSANWSIIESDSIGNLSPVGGTSTTLELFKLGTGRVVAVKGGGEADTTGVITCIAGEIVYLTISPDSIDVGSGDLVQFTVNGYDVDSNLTDVGTITWKALGRSGSIDSTGLFIAGRPGRAKVIATSSIGALTDTTGFIDIEELYLTTISLGNEAVRPAQNNIAMLAFRIENYFDIDKAIEGITLRDLSSGAGNSTELLSNIDSVFIYYDKDNDSFLTVSDSLVASSDYSQDSIALAFSPITITPYSGKTFIVGIKASLYPRDDDSLDIMLVTADDIATSDTTIVAGPDTANSFGVGIVDGMISAQIDIVSTGINQIQPADSLYNIFIVDIPRNGYGNDSLNIFSLFNYGTASVSDMDSLILFSDNGNGSWDGRGTEMRLGELVYTGDRWMISGLNDPLTGQVNRFFIGVKLADYPSNDATIAFGIPVNGLEMSSGNDGPLDNATVPIDTIVIQTVEALTVDTITLSSKILIPGEDSGPLLAMGLMNSYAIPLDMDSLLVTCLAADSAGATQTQLDSQIDSLMLYLNRDADIENISGDDSLIATAIVSNGTALFAVNGLSIPADGGTEDMFVTASMNIDRSRNGNLLKLSIIDSTDLYFSRIVEPEGDFPLTNATYSVIDGFPVANVTVNDIGGGIVYSGQTNQPALDIVLPGNGYAPDSLMMLRITDNGTLLESTQLLTLKLWIDNTNNGYSVDDSLLGQFTTINNYWQISNLKHPIDTSGTRFLITIDISGDQFDAAAIWLTIPADGVTYSSGTDGPDDASVANSQSTMVFPSNRITAISIPAASSTVFPGSSSNNVLTFALYNGYISQSKSLNGITLTNISKSQSNQAYADYELGQVSLYYDADCSRTFNNDSLVGLGYFNQGKLQLTGLNVALPPESLSYFFACADFPQVLIDSDSLAVAVSGPSDFAFSGTVNVNGDLPLTTGGYLVVNGSVHAQYDIIDPVPQTLSPGDTSVTIFAFKPAYNGDLLDTLISVTVGNTGIADTGDISSLELWLDIDSNGTWQSTDSLLGTFIYQSTTWKIDSLNLAVDSARQALFVLGDVSLSATPDVTIRIEMPLNGCQFVSDNAGPVDSTLNSASTFTISASGLQITNLPLQTNYIIGQTIGLGLRVTNVLGGTIDDIIGEIVVISDSSLVTLDSSIAGPVTLTSGTSTDFTFYFTADAVGEIHWRLRALSTATSDSSAIVQTAATNIQQMPSEVMVQMINSVPTSVTRGQANVFPLSIGFSHPDSVSSVASLKLDNIVLSIENGTGQSIYASEVFSRMILATEYSNLVILESIPHQSAITLNFNQPVIINPGGEQYFSLLVDIDSVATTDNFVLSIDNGSAIPIVENITGQSVSIASEVTFPLKTASCRIDNAAQMMVVSSTSLLKNHVNYGQKDVDVLELKFRHPGASGSSQIQLTDISLMFIDDLNDTLIIPDLLDLVRIKREQSIIAEVGNFISGVRRLDIQLNSPMTLNVNEIDSLTIQVWINENTTETRFGLLIPDSTSFIVRDLSSGSSLEMATDTVYSLAVGSEFPITSSLAAFELPAVSPELCLTSLLPASVTGGVDSLDLIEISLNYPAGIGYAPVCLNKIFINVFDSAGSPLDPDRLFDRIGYRFSGSAVNYQSYVELQSGRVVFSIDSSGLVFNPGDSQTIYLTADIEPDVPYDNFILMISSENDITIFDNNDTTHIPGFTLDYDCSSTFPFATGQTQVFMPAGRPLLTIESLPVQLVFPGQQGALFSYGKLDYSNEDLQGDLAFGGVTGRILCRSANGLRPMIGSTVFNAIYLLADNQIVAIDSILENDTLRLIPPNPVNIENGSAIEISLKCDIRDDAIRGNYLISFQDSTFADLSDLNLSTVIYPILAGGFPLKTTEVSVIAASLENSYTNYPNPFNPARGEETTIGYVLNEDAIVDIDIYTITGELVKKVVSNSHKISGSHQEDNWFGDNDGGCGVIPGTYFCQITARYTSGKTDSFRRKIAVVR